MRHPHWRTVAGRGSALAVVAAICALDRWAMPLPIPGGISFLAVAVSAYIGGITAGLISGAIAIGYAAFSFSLPGQFLQFRPDNLTRLYIVIVTTPAIAVMVGLLQNRARRAFDNEQAARRDV